MASRPSLRLRGTNQSESLAGPAEGIAVVRVRIPSEYSEKTLHVQTKARVEHVKKMIRSNYGLTGGSLILNDEVCLDDQLMSEGVYKFTGFEGGQYCASASSVCLHSRV
jgi:hypothetical protein